MPFLKSLQDLNETNAESGHNQLKSWKLNVYDKSECQKSDMDNMSWDTLVCAGTLFLLLIYL